MIFTDSNNVAEHNFNQAILAAMEAYSGRICFRVKRDGLYRDVTYRHFQRLTLRLAYFFHQQGINRGQRVAIVADNSTEWMVAYMACLLAGGVVVPLRDSLAPGMLKFILQDSQAHCVVVQTSDQSKIIQDALDELPELKMILVIEKITGEAAKQVSLFSVLSASVPPEAQDALRRHAESIPPDADAAIYYTRTETGTPNGAVFTHNQRLKSMHYLATWLTFDDDDVAFTMISWGIVSSLDFALYQFLAGVTNVLAESAGMISTQKITGNMQHTSPTLMLITPFILNRFYSEVIRELSESPESNLEVFNWALSISKAYLAAGPDASEELRRGYARADMTFFSQIRGKVGGRMRRLYSVRASLPQHLADFTEAIGLLPLNIYHLTEAGGFPTISTAGARQPGACGHIGPGFKMRIAADGEVLVKGPTLFKDYWRRPGEKAQIVDSEGWLHTGDLGYLDSGGYLYLTGRKRPFFVLSTGRKIMPERVEQALMESPFIAHAVIFGEGRPYVSALIVPDLEALAECVLGDADDDDATSAGEPASDITWYWLHNDDGEDRPVATPVHPEVKDLLDQAIAKANAAFDTWEQVRVYCLIEQAFSQVADEINALMPNDRHLLADKYQPQVDALYPQTVQAEAEAITEVQVRPERLRELLAKENLLDAWLTDAGIEFLFELAREKQIDAPSIVHICDIAASIAQMEHEETPISTALIVGDTAQIARHLPPSQIQLLRHDHIRRMRKMLVALAPMVDGQLLGFVIDKHGYLRGIHKLDVNLEAQPSTFLLGPQFRRHADISGQCNAVVFFVPTGGKQVRVFSNGELVGRYSNGDWSKESMFRVADRMAELIEQKQYDVSLVQRILRCAFQMSEENLGAIFIIGNADTILERSDAPEISHFAWIVSADLDTMSDAELINFAKQDGATVVDTGGHFRGCMVLLRPAANTQAEIGPGKGARHSSAAKMSAEAQCLAITVSQDGPITIYDSGKRVLSL